MKFHGRLPARTNWKRSGQLFPFIIAMSMFAWGAQLYFQMYRPPQNAAEIYVVGKQWMWKIQHSTGQREINELHVPVGRKIKLIMTSETRFTTFSFRLSVSRPTCCRADTRRSGLKRPRPGPTTLFCAEYCGMNHSGMIGSIIVMQPTEFDNWLSGNAAQQSPAVAGQQLFQSLGCVSCHGANGEGGRGPALAGLFGRQVFLANGQTLIADEAYVRESIENPQAKLVSGFGPIMPTFQGQVTPEQLIQIMSFIKSLQITNQPSTSTPPAGASAPHVPAATATPAPNRQ